MKKFLIYLTTFVLLLAPLAVNSEIYGTGENGNGNHHHHHHHGSDQFNLTPEHELEYSVRMAIGLARGFYENVRITNGQLHVDVNNLNKSTPEFGHMLYRALHGHVDAAKVMDEGKKIVDSMKTWLMEVQRQITMNGYSKSVFVINRARSSVKYLTEWYINMMKRLNEIAEYQRRDGPISGRSSHHHHSSSDVTREEILKSTLELIKDFKTAIDIAHSKVIVDRKMIQHGHNMEAFRRLVQSNDHLQDTKLAQKLLDYLLDKIAEAMLKLNALPHYNRSSKISEMERELSSENLALEKMLNKTEEIMRKEKLQSQQHHRKNIETPPAFGQQRHDKPAQTAQGPNSSEEWRDSTHRHYYHLLGVGKEASSSEIRSAYRRKARKYHPDKHPGKEDKYTRKMQKVTEAYSMLSDKKRRANYDWELKSKGKYH